MDSLFERNAFEQAVFDSIGEFEFPITLFPKVTAKRKNEHSVSLSMLVRISEEISKSSKANLPLIKLGRFGDLRTKSGSYRHDSNLVEITGIEGDYDDGKTSMEAASQKIEAAGITALILPTASYTDECPRWRVLCPLSEPARPSLRKQYVARLDGVLGGVLASESYTDSQAFYFGSVENCDHPKPILIDGDFLDRLEDLDIESPDTDESMGESLDHDWGSDNLHSHFHDVNTTLFKIRNDGTNPRTNERAGWVRIGAAVFNSTAGSNAGEAIFIEWSKLHPTFDLAATKKLWASFSSNETGGVANV